MYNTNVKYKDMSQQFNVLTQLTKCSKLSGHTTLNCRLKAYTVFTFGGKNQSFRNKSGKAQPIRTKFGIRGHVNG